MSGGMQVTRAEDGAEPRSLLRTVYRGKATNIALVLLVSGIGLLAWAANVHEGIRHDMIRDFGLASLISGLLGTAYEYLLRHDYEGSMRNNLRMLLENEEILRKSYAERLASYENEGLVGIHSGLSGDLLKRKFEAAKEGKSDIKILQTWTGLEETNIMRLLRGAVQAGCSIKVLLLNPDSIQVRYRAHAQRVSADEFRRRIISDLRQLNDIGAETQGPGDIMVKVYDATPVFHVFDFGTTKLMGPYWRREKSVWGTQFEVAEHSDLGGLINAHFNDLWDSERKLWDGQPVTKDASEVLNEYADSTD
jgi:hypothetical protein